MNSMKKRRYDWVGVYFVLRAIHIFSPSNKDPTSYICPHWTDEEPENQSKYVISLKTQTAGARSEIETWDADIHTQNLYSWPCPAALIESHKGLKSEHLTLSTSTGFLWGTNLYIDKKFWNHGRLLNGVRKQILKNHHRQNFYELENCHQDHICIFEET